MDEIKLHYNSKLLKYFFRSWVDAFTFKNHIFVRDSSIAPELLAHESVHVEQYKRLGTIKFLAMYLYYSIKYGYEKNPLEVEARKANG